MYFWMMKLRGKLKIHRIQPRWKHNIPESLGCKNIKASSYLWMPTLEKIPEITNKQANDALYSPVQTRTNQS